MHKYWEDKYKEQSEVIIDDRMRELPFLAFDGDRDLRFISLPDSVTKICFRAFKDCTALEKITLITEKCGIIKKILKKSIGSSKISAL